LSGLFRQARRDGDEPETATQLDGLLAEMRDLRLTLAADLSTAAGAVEAGADGVAADIVEADRLELARFARFADQRLQRLAGEAPARPAWRRRVAVALPVVPVVGAMAFSAAAATGALHLPGHSPATHRPAVVRSLDNTPIASTFRNLVTVLDNNPSRSQVMAAASKLHQQLSQLIENSPHNPAGAAQIAELLRMEQSLLMREQPPGAKAVLNATRKLSARLVSVSPQLSPTVAPTFVPSVPPSQPPKHKAPSPSATPKQSASPKPSPSASSHPSSASPSPSPTRFPALPGG
jgi:hypothetical protein